MFAGPAEVRSNGGAPQKCAKDAAWPESRVKKKTRCPEVTLPRLCEDPPSFSAAWVARSRSLSHRNVSPGRPLSAVKLPVIAPGGPRRATEDKKETEGPTLMSSTSQTTMKAADKLATQSLTGKGESLKVIPCQEKQIATVKKGKAARPDKVPLTGTDVVHVLSKKRDPGELDYYYLKEVDGDACRPYDLRVVRSSEAGSEHFIFSPDAVLRVTDGGYGGLVSLPQWSRERDLWTALQEILFFRNFRLRKAFSWWNRNVRKIIFQRRREGLQDTLLIAVPRFRNALLLLTRVIEELKATHRLPQEETRTYTLLEFKNTLITASQEFLQMLETLSQQRVVILNVVKEGSFKAHQELQLHREYAKKPDKGVGPIHLHRAHRQELQREATRSESVLQKLGSFGALVNEMIVQSLVTTVQRDAVSFIDNVLKRRKYQRRTLFHTELCFSASGQLTVDPPLHLFQEAVTEALLTAGDSVIQMCETCGFFLESSGTGIFSSGVTQLTSDLTGIEHLSVAVENMSSDGLTGHRMFCCWKSQKEASSSLPASKDTSATAQGVRARGSFRPLSKRHLQRQIGINDVTRRAQKELAAIMQEAELEILQLGESHSWLTDVYSFISQWGRGSAESMAGQPASLYEERVQTLRRWADRINTAPSSVATSNRLFTIQFTAMKERLGQRLKLVEEEILQQLVLQTRLRSESVTSDLQRASAQLKAEPRDVRDVSKYALTVRESVRTMADVQKRLEYIHSLQEVVRRSYRRMTEEEEALEEKMLRLWDRLTRLLKPADGILRHCRASASDALDAMSAFLVRDLKDVVSKATSGPSLDPTQNPREMVSALNYTCAHVRSLKAKLEQLSTNRQNLQEHPVDLTIFTSDLQEVEARKELWEVKAVVTTWLDEWKTLVFSEDSVSRARRKVAEWREKALSLTRVLPSHDAVLQETLATLECLSHQLAVMAEIQEPALKRKHLTAIFEGLGLQYVPEKKFTFAELTSQLVKIDQKRVTKICRDAQAEHNMKETFQKLRQAWDARLFHLDPSLVRQHCEPQGLTETEEPTGGAGSHLQAASEQSRDDGRFTILDLEIHLAETENDSMTLSTMMKSPHGVELRTQMEDWAQTLRDLGKLLCLFEKFQGTWAFLTKTFQATANVQKTGLREQFQPVDETFRKIMLSVSNDPHVLNFVHSAKANDRFHGSSLCQSLTDGLSTMESISNQMVDLLDASRQQCLRLWLLSDRETMDLLSCRSTPVALLPFVRKCFTGIRWLEVDRETPCNSTHGRTSCRGHSQVKVPGAFGSLWEHITFPSPLEPNCSALVWLRVFEKQLKLTVMQLIKRCAAELNQLEIFSPELACDKKAGDMRCHVANGSKIPQPVQDLLSEYPLQCLLVAEEAVWCKIVLHAFQKTNPVKMCEIRDQNSAKLKDLCRSIRDGLSGARSESLVSKYTMTRLRALVQLKISHAGQLSRLTEVQNVPLESSFEWLSLMKYHVNVEDCSLKGSNRDPTCYVDVLGHRFQYDYEYFGPEGWEMVHTPSTDRAILGILLALRSYRCGFVSGPHMSGKKTTVVQLGKALGRLVVCMQCCPSVTPSVIQRLLLGALQTGAWLVLCSVDSLKQRVLSFLGEHLAHIHQSFSDFSRNKTQRANEDPKDRTAEAVDKVADSECRMVLAGKSLSASLSYGCVGISSKSYASEIPKRLQYAARPVALTRPDYSIIAEVMLTSSGFSEAAALSRQLVSLFSLAKDSLCLPDFLTDDQSGHLVVLRKIISASQMHFQESIKQRELSHRAGGSAAEHADPTSSRIVEKDRKESGKRSTLHSSHWSIVRGLMEETAIVKALLSVLMPGLYEHKKASQFDKIFKETFPIACQFPVFQQYFEEEEKNKLEEALAEELQRKRLHSDTKIISAALSLHQTMKLSQAVVLVGPPGSGKTTCYSALAGALNHLAAGAVEDAFDNNKMIEAEGPKAEPQISDSPWTPVNTVVLFPNAMSREEVFGFFCEKRGWQDGAVAKVLRDSGRHERTRSANGNRKRSQLPIVTWLVMDGKPVGQPGWLDYVSTLCGPEDPFLCLPSGEVLPTQSHFKLLLETTDLRDASPSAVTRCSLVHFPGSDLWDAVWKSEFSALASEPKLDRGTLKMWNCLAEDLFPGTLASLRQKVLTPAIHNGESLQEPVCGLQEIQSFVRILRALLRHSGKEVETAESRPQMDKRDEDTTSTDSQNKQEILARNLFLVAYIWGFGGHLHPRHWPQFNRLARQLLFNCRYRILVPEEQSVFEHFFNTDGEKSHKNTQLTTSVSPKYGKYTYLLSLMLEANQPVLLAGEPGSGKTTLCKTLLSFDKPHISLPANPLLSSRKLRVILNDMSLRRNCRVNMASVPKQPRLLLFVDDLHDAPCDVYGTTSAALETLRQSISHGEILTFDSHHFKVLSSESVGYMATCSVFGSGGQVTSRLSRLFSIFVLPSSSLDVIFSVHSPPLKMWLGGVPLKRSVDETARCIVAATKSLYHAVCDQFQPTAQKPHFTFSHRDLQKVFRGMCLWRPDDQNTEAMRRSVVRLWMHECLRTFGDRLSSEVESRTLVSLIAKTATAHYGIGSIDEPIDQSDLGRDQTVTELSRLSERHHAEEAGLQPHLLQPEIIRHTEAVMADLVYGPDLSEALMSTNLQQTFRRSYRRQNLDALLAGLCTLIGRIDDEGDDGENSVATRCVLHRQRANQLAHILRALVVPGGHGVLMASEKGTGRKTNVRLAARLTGCQLMEVHPGNENKIHHILTEAGSRTRVDGVHVIVLVHEGIRQSVREEVLVAMARGTYPGLHTDEELRNRVSKETAEKKSRRYLLDSWMFEKFLSQIHRNVHVFLLFPLREIPASNSTHTLNAQLTKAVSLSCCVEAYQPWSHRSLAEVASLCLQSSPSKTESEGSEASLSAAMAGIHRSACRYASVLLGAQPFSPQTYMAFIAHFDHLCTHLRERRQSRAKRLAAALARWDVMNNTAERHKRQLMRLQQKVAGTRQREAELLQVVHNQRRLLEEAHSTFVVTEKQLYDLEEQINQAQEQLRPLLSSGLEILNCLSASDLEEVRRYRDPPDGVVKIMDAVCLLFNRPPGWESAKQLLGQSNFFQELEFFDRFALMSDQLQQLDLIVHSPRFVSQPVEEVSRACDSLLRWVQAVYERCCMWRHLQAEKRLEALAGEARAQLRLSERRREEAGRRLEEAKLQLQLLQKELEEEELELRDAEREERDAAVAVRRVESHVRGWRTAAREAELSNLALAGDALNMAAIISYLGPFGPDIRTELLSKWRDLCQTGRIHTDPEDPRASLFTRPDAVPPRPLPGFPVPVSERLQLPLSQTLGSPPDAPAAGMVEELLLWGCRRAWAQHWPLLADTGHRQGESAGLEMGADWGLVVCADDPDLLDKLDQAAEKGLRVLVTHVERAGPSPRFLARLARRPAGCRLLGLKPPVQPSHPEFCLFLGTHLPVRLLSNDVHPAILAQVLVVDLRLSSEQIQELLLTRLMPSASKKLLSQLRRLQRDERSLKEKLISEEESLTDYILQSETSLLRDPDFLPRVALCQEAVTKLRSEARQMSEEQGYHESLLAAPRRLAMLAATLYRALQQVSRLSPAYCFPLPGFIAVLRGAFDVGGGPLVSCDYGKVPAGVVAEVTNRMATQLLAQYRPCLVKRHASVLKLLVSVALLQHDQLCSGPEGAAFLRGLRDIKPRPPPPAVPQATSALPSWMPPHIHPDLLCLERIPAFSGLISSLSTRPVQWQQYLRFPSSTVVGAVPCLSHSHLSLMQRALLWKTVLPECLEGLADAMAVYLPFPPRQTAESEAPDAGNPEALSRFLVRHEGPVILMLPCSRSSIQPLHLIHKLACCTADAKKVWVKVISFGAQRDDEVIDDVILQTLDKAVSDGHWLVFNNCHLLERWDGKLVARLGQLISDLRERRCLVHPCFRLWFITEECTSCSIPGAVRMSALPLVCDSPWDLRDELSCSLRQAASIIQSQPPSGVAEDDAELRLRCAVFHSVLLQRQTCKHSGRRMIYNWNQEDLLALMEAHASISSLCQDQTKALQYVAVNLVHGGHVLDSADLAVVESVAEICFSRAPPLGDGGQHALSDIISSFDFTGQRLQDSANIGDPLLLGFSADEAADIIRINGHSLNALLQASQAPVGSARSVSEPPACSRVGEVRARLQTLKASLENQSDDTNPGAGAIRDFLLSERDELVDYVSSLLKGGAPTFAPLHDLADVSRLERRAKLLGAYLRHGGTSDPLGAYRLSAFKNARGFLAAARSQAAKLHRKSISDIELHFQVAGDASHPASLPSDVVYLCGLELRGASWDAHLGALVDAASPQQSSLPLVCVRAKVRSTNAGRHAPPCESSQLPVYHCPLYLDGQQGEEESGLTDAHVVIRLPLRAKLHPVFCSLRRVRLVSLI